MSIDEIRGKLEAAKEELRRVSGSYGHSWKMSIPVQPYDSDVLIGDGLAAVDALLAEVARLTAERDALKRQVDTAKSAFRTVMTYPITAGWLVSKEALADIERIGSTAQSPSAQDAAAINADLRAIAQDAPALAAELDALMDATATVDMDDEDMTWLD